MMNIWGLAMVISLLGIRRSELACWLVKEFDGACTRPDCGYCQFFTRFGKCNKDDEKCPYIHEPSKVAVCTKFLKGLCSNPNCKLSHKVIPERMLDCSYYLQGAFCAGRSIAMSARPSNQLEPAYKGPNASFRTPETERRKRKGDEQGNKEMLGDSADFISIDVNDEEEAGENNDPIREQASYCDSDSSELELDELDRFKTNAS
ncbi:hypothetical protein ACFX12_043830 [Malus domestica]